MSEMVERVARLDATLHGMKPDADWEEWRPGAEWRARQLIEAMREFPETALFFGQKRKRWWREMIDAALDSPPKV